MKHRKMLLSTAFVSALLLMACADATLEPLTDESPEFGKGGPTPMCQLGCGGGGVDPSPGEPGYWIEFVDLDICDTYSDYDLDGLGDYCELRIASAFSPELFYNRFDNVAYEPKWAAQPFTDLEVGYFVRIFYALSYYRDGGPVSGAEDFCDAFGDLFGFCHPHWGDAESIVLDVVYDEESFHWKLVRAHFSRHEIWESWYPGELYFPDADRGYPRVWVARQKHANYRSDAACDAGGPVGDGPHYAILEALQVDDCQSNKTKRPILVPATNLGSNVDTLTQNNCFTSVDPVALPGIECYWTDSIFNGWESATPNSEGYMVRRLPDAGFFLGTPAAF